MAFQKLVQISQNVQPRDGPALFQAEFDVFFLQKKYFNILISVNQKKIISFELENNKKNRRYQVRLTNQTTFLTSQDKQQNNCQKTAKQPIFSIQIKKYDEYIQISTKNNQVYNQLLHVLKAMINQTNFFSIFHLNKKVGNGSFASVYQLQKKEGNQKYAAKVFDKKKCQQRVHGCKIIHKELDISRELAKKAHPNILKFQSSYQDPSSVYLCYELCDGGSLDDKIKKQFKFMNKHIKKIILGILSGLSHLHKLNIMHRDIKPQNIMFRTKYDLESVIIDFGFATQVGDYKLFSRCGTPGYVAPQIANLKSQKASYDMACDIFSVGVILHLLIYKSRLFQGETFNQILKENRACKIDFNDTKYDALPAQWKDFMQKLLKQNPEQRITAQQALRHQFFNVSEFDNQFIGINKNSIKNSKEKYIRSRFNPLCQQNFLPNKEKKQLKKKVVTTKLFKDSCLSFVVNEVQQKVTSQEMQQADEYADIQDSPKAKITALKTIPINHKSKRV